MSTQPTADNKQSGGAFVRRGLELLQRHRVQVKAVPSNFLNGTRISTHLFNSERDVDALIAALTVELA